MKHKKLKVNNIKQEDIKLTGAVVDADYVTIAQHTAAA